MAHEGLCDSWDFSRLKLSFLRLGVAHAEARSSFNRGVSSRLDVMWGSSKIPRDTRVPCTCLIGPAVLDSNRDGKLEQLEFDRTTAR